MPSLKNPTIIAALLFTLTAWSADPKRCVDSIQNHLAPFQLQGRDGTTIQFKIEGREQSKRRFEVEAIAFQKASAEDWVILEWMYHPFMPVSGTNSFRIGKTNYSFGHSGWIIRESDQDNARSYLFNFPVFKNYYQRYKHHGMPAFSIGIPLRLKKSQVLALTELIERNRNYPKKPFSILFNNCSQCVIGAFKESELGDFSPTALRSFSSLFTTRAVLQQTQYHYDSAVLYLLPGSNLTLEQIKKQIPRALYDRITLEEILLDFRVTSEHAFSRISAAFWKPFDRSIKRIFNQETHFERRETR